MFTEAQLRAIAGDEAYDAIPDAPQKAVEKRKAQPPSNPRRAAESRSARSVRRVSGPREKMFGSGRCVRLDREAKVRITVLIRALTHPTEKGKHYGAITAKAAEVARTLLWVFHNVIDGRCFPSYERIAEAAHCHRDTVAEAIKMLERAGVLTWCNRLVRVVEAGVRKVHRTSNAYRFNDPGCKSEIATGTKNHVLERTSSLCETAPTTRTAAKRLGEEAGRRGPGVPDGVYPCESEARQ